MRRIGFVTALTVRGLIGAGAAGAMTLTSPEIKAGGKIADEQVFNSFGCTGQNVSPSLSWSGAPKGTKSFAVSMYDPDAPTGSGWWHWWVVNIPADATSLPKGAGRRNGTAGRGDAGAHRLQRERLWRPMPSAGQAASLRDYRLRARCRQARCRSERLCRSVGFNAHAHVLAKATLVALYGR